MALGHLLKRPAKRQPSVMRSAGMHHRHAAIDRQPELVESWCRLVGIPILHGRKHRFRWPAQGVLRTRTCPAVSLIRGQGKNHTPGRKAKRLCRRRPWSSSPRMLRLLLLLVQASPASSGSFACNVSLALAMSSSCPSEVWASHILPQLAAPSMVMINVGANKGFNVNTFLQRYGRGWTITNAQWLAYLKSSTNRNFHWLLCGVCRACNATVLARYGQADVQVLAVELMGQNARLLESAFAHFGVPGNVVHAAGGEAVGSTFEPIDTNSTLPGREQGAIAASGRRVPMVTVDSLIRRYNLSDVSILSIDAEGHDGAVLRGAAFAFAHRIVSVVEFEYHLFGLWANEKLGDSISTMARYGYKCFWQSHSGWLSPFLPDCNYEFHRWSNVVCSHDPKILRVLTMLIPEGLRTKHTREGSNSHSDGESGFRGFGAPNRLPVPPQPGRREVSGLGLNRTI